MRLPPARAAALLLALAALASRLPAQAPPARTFRNALSIQPIHAVFGAWSAEYERFVRPTLSVAGSATWFDEGGFDWDDYGDDATLTLDLKARLYPEAWPFDGFSLGVLGGAYRERVPRTGGEPPTYLGSTVSDWAPTVGVTLERGWLDKRTGRMLVAGGIGAKRVFRAAPFEDEGFLTVRLSIGYAF